MKYRWEKLLRLITIIQSMLGMVLLITLMLIGTVDVLGRYLFDSPIKGAYEISELLLAGIVFFGIAYALSIDGHVKVNTLMLKLNPRMRRVISIVMSSLALSIFILISWQGTMLAYKSWTTYRMIDVIDLPIAPFQLLVPIGCLAVCFELILQITSNRRRMKEEK